MKNEWLVGTPPQVLSPLRYPGAKRQLIPFFVDLLAANPPRVRCFVEAFAGGASVGLYLAANDLVDSVVLADRDPLVHSFWKVACFDTDWLIAEIEQVEVTLARWEHFRAHPGTSARDQALACLFLNRTSFSGILQRRAGPIGGKKQVTEYKIDCRFPKDTIEQRLRQVQALAKAGKISAVWRSDVTETIRRVCGRYPDDRKGVFFYLDPPFYVNAERLYTYTFAERDHRRLARRLRCLDHRWVLSYDYHPNIQALYAQDDADHRLHLIGATYSAASAQRLADELIVTNLENVPTEHIQQMPTARSSAGRHHAEGYKRDLSG